MVLLGGPLLFLHCNTIARPSHLPFHILAGESLLLMLAHVLPVDCTEGLCTI